jgi:2-polyprenyl-6-hydroxyphenyl methylase/3-demethylubiquinone-9 3-methyltransferase
MGGGGMRVRLSNIIRRMKQSWGTAEIKRRLWNKEFQEGHWDFIDHTQGDVVYDVVGRYCRKGRILDLGCGSGNTGCELDVDLYATYVGVDVSDVALEKAVSRSRKAGRQNRNRYVRGDIVDYVPEGKFDVILFRESIYYVQRSKIAPLLIRYAESLAPEGVIIVRWHDHKVALEFLEMLGLNFRIVESFGSDAAGPFIVVFQPR